MTHEELLAKSRKFTCCSGAHEFALEAVMKLHQPEPVAGAEPICGECYLGEEGFAEYPCKTIREIERVIGE